MYKGSDVKYRKAVEIRDRLATNPAYSHIYEGSSPRLIYYELISLNYTYISDLELWVKCNDILNH